MGLDIKKIEYYNITVNGGIGEGAALLSMFADIGISLLAFKAVDLEPMRTRFTLFPDDSLKMNDEAKKAGLNPDGPHPALFIEGDNDESGELANIFTRLARADVDVQESNGIANINGSYGVILCLKQEDCEKAVAALEK